MPLQLALGLLKKVICLQSLRSIGVEGGRFLRERLK